MVARHSEIAKLIQAKNIARSGNCFIVQTAELSAKNVSNNVWLLYRCAEPKNIKVGKRRSIDGILQLVKKVCAVG